MIVILYEILYIFVIIISFLTSAIILLKIHKTQKKIFFLAESLFFGFFGVARIFYYIWDFIEPDHMFWVLGVSFAMVAMTFLLFAIERKIIHGTKYVFTIFAIFAVILIIIPFSRQIHLWIQTIMVTMLAPVGIIYFWVIAKRSFGEVRKLAITYFVGVFIWASGQFFRSQLLRTVEWLYYITAPLLFIFGNIIVLYVLVKRVIELEWPDKIDHLFIIYSVKGINLYEYSFTEKKLAESDLIAGSISGITGLLQEITKSKRKLKLMDQEDIKIILEYGTYVMGALVTQENFGILRKKLQKLVRLFELKYKDHLKQFSGLVNEYESSQELIEYVFSPKDIYESKILK
ncbi:MAG: hypothetical protein HWN66_16435 [Candidatus Helarchaeota archaeon]|nr:hypothetical protein [Candidatus Helarchaeota archaeon]